MSEQKKLLDIESKGEARVAYELINLFASSMRALNDGVLPLPKSWENYLNSLIVPENSRRKPEAQINRRKIELAKKVIEEKISAKKGGKRAKLKNISGAPDSKNIYRDIKRVMCDAKLELLYENEKKREEKKYNKLCKQIKQIEALIKSGEDARDILLQNKFCDEVKGVLLDHVFNNKPLVVPPKKTILSEKDKAYRWMNNGLSLAINPVHRDFGISLVYPEDRAVVMCGVKNKQKK